MAKEQVELLLELSRVSAKVEVGRCRLRKVEVTAWELRLLCPFLFIQLFTIVFTMQQNRGSFKLVFCLPLPNRSVTTLTGMSRIYCPF